MSDLKIRAKSQLKLTNGTSNMTWEFSKGSTLSTVLGEVIYCSGFEIEELEKIKTVAQEKIDDILNTLKEGK